MRSNSVPTDVRLLSLVVANAADSCPSCLDEGFFEQGLVDLYAASAEAGDVLVTGGGEVSKSFEFGCVSFVVLA
jgi:hypothetical protein